MVSLRSQSRRDSWVARILALVVAVTATWAVLGSGALQPHAPKVMVGDAADGESGGQAPETGESTRTEDSELASASSLPVNEWHSLTPSEARAAVPWLRRIPTPETLPPSLRWDGKLAVMPWDADGDGASDLYRVHATMSPVDGTVDENGHGNTNIVWASAPLGPPTEQPVTDELSDGRTVSVTKSGPASVGLTWWEQGVFYQVMGDERSTLIQVAEGMRLD